MSEYTMTGTRAASGAGELCGPSLTIPLERLAAGDSPAALELLLAALAADVLTAAHQAALALRFDEGDTEVRVRVAPASGGGLVLSYELSVGTAEPEARLGQLHAELRRSAPVMRILGAAMQLTGRVRQRSSAGAV